MSRRTLLACALAALALPLSSASSPAAGTKLTDDQLAEVMDFTMHDATFTLFHESGHLLIHELDLPVLGKEEDAADIAGVLEMFRSITDKDEAYNALNDVADYWTYSSNAMTDEDFSYNVNTYDDHSLDVQRANNMVCLMVGKDQDEFADTAQAFEFDDDMIGQCLTDYEQADHSWTKVLASYVAKAPGPEIKVTYEATSSVAYEIPRRMPPRGVGRGAEITQTGHGSSFSRASTDVASERDVWIAVIGTVRRFTRSSGRLAWRRTLGSITATGTQETHGAGDDLDGNFLAVLL